MTRFFTTIFLSLLFPCFSAQAEILTFKVERLVTSRSDSYGDNLHGLAPQLAQIEISAAVVNEKKAPFPKREDFEQIILVGTKGIAHKAYFHEFEKRCEYLCGDELEECHYTALVSWQGHDIGVPLLAVTNLPGTSDDFVSYLNTVAADDITDLSIPELPLVWPKNNALSVQLQQGEAEFNVSYKGDYHYQYTAQGQQCRWFDYPGTTLARLSCDGAELLLDNKHPLLFSYADYNIPNVQIVNRFTVKNQAFYTVSLALKAYTAYGLLTKEKGKWRFIVTTANWARLC